MMIIGPRKVHIAGLLGSALIQQLNTYMTAFVESYHNISSIFLITHMRKQVT